jgi:hypothetical protein
MLENNSTFKSNLLEETVSDILKNEIIELQLKIF